VVQSRKLAKGIGGPCQITSNPNAPTFDPCGMKRNDKISAAIEDERLTDWEKSFLMDVYGQGKLTKKQNITISRILKRLT
jgi:hypothetical protein